MGTPVYKNPIAKERMTPKLLTPTNEIPFKVAITSSVREKAEQDDIYKDNPSKAPKNPPHVNKKAIDIADDDAGWAFWNWIDTPEGQSWKKRYGARVLYHDIGKGSHYHIEYNYQHESEK